MKQDTPKINVFNRQRGIRIETTALKDFAAQLSCRMQLEAGFSVVLVNDSVMQRYQLCFTGKDKPTDQLSFPYQKENWDNEPPYLGDILISVETADRQRKDTLAQEIQVLILHGVLHLLGYDHETDQGKMEGLETQLKKEFRLR